MKQSAAAIKLGKRIKSMRLKLNMSPLDFFKKTAIAPPILSEIELGTNILVDAFIPSIAKAFGIETWMLTGLIQKGAKIKYTPEVNVVINKGLKEFIIDGKSYYAINYKNAVRKSKK
jgi:transcriptional regulator with XRE-family HTH domain